MKKFNINDYFYIQITDIGWKHLMDTAGDDYIYHSIKPYEKIINGDTWYKLQCHQVFDLFPMDNKNYFNTNVLIQNNDLSDLEIS